MRVLAACIACIILAACTTQSSGVLKMGPDTYSASAAATPIAGGYSEARRIALTEANQYCLQMGREILVENIGAATYTSAQVTFRCLSKDDPELQRPEYRPAPDTIIEDRRK